MNDEYYMRRSLRLARRGLGKTSPNPAVGAVIVSDGAVVGQGYHEYFGGNHAEINAIQNAAGKTSGSTLYVTLEPCCHYRKKTPPCVDAIIKHGLARVVVGTIDPNPEVNCRGIQVLREHGIETTVGVLADECYRLNQPYFKYIQTGESFVTLKFAQTLDGRIATAAGNSQWISSDSTRRLAHRLRSLHDAIMVGIGTVMADNPQLTVRLVKGRSPIRVIPDSRLKISLNARVLQNQDVAPTIIATTLRADEEKMAVLERTGIEVLMVDEDESGEVDLGDLLKTLGKRGISSVLVEGGGKIITSLFDKKLVDRVVLVVAPKVMGKGIEAVGDLSIRGLDAVLKLSFVRTYRKGEDLVIEADAKGDEIKKSVVRPGQAD
ncbi:MAG: bifunctional diaminohydroxyphosphoribosylaminopyrimidine deaminase/5-amino-6-(5-phosphoribosylamino)uracil reductase RibD [Chloroflexota bacterium]